MERYWHPQSPTHRSPDLPQPSLTMLAQAMDQQRPMEPTPAQRFVIEQQQAMQLEQQQKQQQKQQQATSASPRPHITQQQPALAAPHGFSESSSTAVDTDLSSSKAPSTDSRMSMFESAASSSSSLEDTFQQVLSDGLTRIGLQAPTHVHGYHPQVPPQQQQPIQTSPPPIGHLTPHPSQVLIRLDDDDDENDDDDDDEDNDDRDASSGHGHASLLLPRHAPAYNYIPHDPAIDRAKHTGILPENDDDHASGGGSAAFSDRVPLQAPLHIDDDDADADNDDDEDDEDDGGDGNDEDDVGYRLHPDSRPLVPTTPSQPPQQQQSAVYTGADDDVGKNGDVGGDIWQDFQPEYSMVNESYLKAKTNIYTDLEQSLNLLQELETRFETSKHQFQSKIEKQYEAWSRQLDDQRHLLERRQRTLHEREPKKQITFQNKIKLNVGGDLFETSLTTLQRDPLSLLAMMFSGRHVLDPDQDGAYFIDRDPTHFRLVLNYLRDLRLAPSAIESPTVCQELLQEAQYYRIHGLVKLLEQTRL